MAISKYGLFVVIAMLVAMNTGHPARADYAGEMRYNYATKQMEFHDGTQWYNFGLGIALGACSQEAEMEFDPLLAAYQVCNGTNWIKIVGIPTLALCSRKGAMDFSGDTFLVCNGLVWTNIKGTPSV